MNLFSAEPLIIARLRAKTTGFHAIGTASRLAKAKDPTLDCPAAYLVPRVSGIAAETLLADSICERQRWTVVVTVQHLATESDTVTTLAAASPLCGSVINALQGWVPGTDLSALAYTGREEPAYEPGMAKLFLNFECVATLTVAP